MDLKDILTIERDSEAPGLLILTFNRPRHLNSFIKEQFQAIVEGLRIASEDDEVVAVLLLGSGRFFSSGMDIKTQFADMNSGGDLETRIEKSIKEGVWAMLEALINFKKPIIAGVNGKAVGIGVTMLGLFDFVYAVESATFRTPFMELAVCAEGCSSFTFPALMGLSKANELLLLGREIDAQEAKDRNLVAQVFPDSEFHARVMTIARRLASLPPQALRDTKELVRGPMRESLLDTNRRELTLLKPRFLSEESTNAIFQFYQKLQKKKAARL